MKRFLGYFKDYKWYMIFGPFFKLLESISDLLNPILMAKIIDIGVTAKDYNYIFKIGLFILIINAMAFGFSVVGQKFASITSAKVSLRLREDLFDSVSNFSHNELDKFGTASLINRITNDVNQVENAVGIFMRTVLRIPFLLIGAFILSLTINLKMSLVFLVLIPVVSVILIVYTKKTSPYYSSIKRKLDNISKVTKENLDGVRVIRAFNKQSDDEIRFEEVNKDYTKTNIRVTKISALLEPGIFLIVDAAIAALIGIGGWQVNIGASTQGDVIALIDYVSMITISLLLLSQIIVVFVRTGASLKRINEVFNSQPSVRNKVGVRRKNNQQFDALMEFDDVSFNYTQDLRDISFIKDLSFKIYPHQTIGIIGGTGSGKSTIASLMTRFYDCTRGQILYKGINIKDYPIEQIRDEISIVQQRSTLFKGTLRDNMKLKNTKATDAEIIEALKISQSWQFVSEWNNGLDHQIMAGGKNVSGGQMQRLTIARAIVNKAEMLILDDSSSALDFLTDSNLRKELKKLNTTLVMISQRATSIKSADLIIVLDNGDVVGMGKHADLMKSCDIYREIYESQSK